MKKRSPTAYNFLTKDKELRAQMLRENPEWKQPQVMAEYSRLWKTYTPEEKEKYILLAEQAKKEFEQAKDAAPLDSDSNSSDSESAIVEKPKKARTPFFCYLHDPEVRAAAKEAHPDLKVAQLTKEISSDWKAMSEDEQAPWKQKSEDEKEELLKNPIMVKRKTKKTKKSKKEKNKDKDNEMNDNNDKVTVDKELHARVLALEQQRQELTNMVLELRKQIEEIRDQ